MEITYDQKKKIEEISSDIKCVHDFKCYNSRFSDVCKVKSNGSEEFLECLEDSRDCEFSLSFGKISHCLCPVQIYITTELKK